MRCCRTLLLSSAASGGRFEKYLYSSEVLSTRCFMEDSLLIKSSPKSSPGLAAPSFVLDDISAHPPH